MARYICKSCSFRFEHNKSEMPKKCPYCNAKASVAKEQTAEEILDELGEE